MTTTRGSRNNANRKKGSGESSDSAILIDDEVTTSAPVKAVNKKSTNPKPISSSAKR